ncbi:MAG: Trk system potassium transporter TrkA [Clostridia bacterium]|nr:Trk system potassium transporter TrkA [Clostridia bacterium]
MNIVIVGDGKVGYTLAACLAKENHDVTIVDQDAAALEKASETLDVMCVKGNGANVRTLLEAGADEADVLIAVTTNDEMNMVCCLAAKQLGAGYTVARIRDPEYTESLTVLQDKLNIDLVTNPERATAMEISRLLRFPFAINVETFAHGRVEMVEFRVDEFDPIANMSLITMHQRYPGVLCSAVLRGHEAIIPDGRHIIRAGDRMHVLGDILSITNFFKKLGKDTKRVRSAMLLGGGHISYYFAKSTAGMGMNLSIIEILPEKCRRLSEQLGDEVNVICGDAAEEELLEQENLTQFGALVCLLDRDEENMMTGLYAVRRGLGKVVVKVDRPNYVDVLSDMGLDSVVSPKLTTADTILRSVRALARSQSSAVVEKLYRVVEDKVEALEFTAKEGAPYLNIPLSRLRIRKGVLVAVLVRSRKIIIPFGDDHIEAGDTVILIARASTIGALEDAIGEGDVRR